MPALPTPIIRLIKLTSIVLITGAIALELWAIAPPHPTLTIPPGLMPLRWLGRIAVIAHAIEGVIAAVLAPSRGKHPLAAGFYTFWVGTVGLKELVDENHRPDH